MSCQKSQDKGKTVSLRLIGAKKVDFFFYFDVAEYAVPVLLRIKVATRSHVIANTEQKSEEVSRCRVVTTVTWRRAGKAKDLHDLFYQRKAGRAIMPGPGSVGRFTLCQIKQGETF
jgi:hypothetical protein